MRLSHKRAHQAYVQTVASAGGVDGDGVPRGGRDSYVALHRVYKPDVVWPEPDADWAARTKAHLREHLARCPQRGGDGLALHLGEHEAALAAGSAPPPHSGTPPGSPVEEGEPPETAPTLPPASAPDGVRRYRCVSRAVVTVGKELPSLDTSTGRPAGGQIVGVVEVEEVLTVADSDVDFTASGVPRLHVAERGGWVSVCAQDGTELLQQLAPDWHDSSAGSLPSLSLSKEGGDLSGADDGEGPRSSLDVHLDPLGQGKPDTPPQKAAPEPKEQKRGLRASVSPGRYRAMFDFEPEEDGDLQLAKGVVVLLMRKTHAHWWEGAVETEPGKVGLFPFNYVQPLLVVRADHELPPGEEITVALPAELCPPAGDGVSLLSLQPPAWLH